MKKPVILILALILIFSADVYAKGKMRIGVYDSRAVAICFYRSEAFNKEMSGLVGDFKKAKENKDTALAKKLEEKGQLMQKIAHDKAFGRGSVAEILEKNSDDLKALAKKENLMAISSKWELNYSATDIELVDITLKILDIIKAPDDVKKMYDEIKVTKPLENAFFLED